MTAVQVESFRVKKQTTLAEFKQMVAEKWGIAVEQQRFWMWATRQNRSVRPSTPLAPSSDENRVCDIRVSARTSPKPKAACRLGNDVNLRCNGLFYPGLCVSKLIALWS